MSEIQADLRLRYPAFSLDVSLRLPMTGVSVILGPSGCGKTTVLRALAGLERAHGRILLNGVAWQDDSAMPRCFVPTHKRPIGYVFQEASLFPHLSVRGNVTYGLDRIPVDQRRVQVDEAVALMGIGHLMERRPERLSGGERQRVAMARALLASPRLLLMDEPLSALDAARKAEILPYLERLNRQARIPMVYVTHALDEAARLADHLVLMNAGKVQASGQAAELFARLDLPLSQLDEAAAVVVGVVSEHDSAYGQSRIDLGGVGLWVGLCDAAPGQPVRARVLARDVSIARSRARDSSITNILPVEVVAVRHDGVNAVTLSLRLVGARSACAQILLARLTRRSFDALGLHVGEMVHAQVKGAALMG